MDLYFIMTYLLKELAYVKNTYNGRLREKEKRRRKRNGKPFVENLIRQREQFKRTRKYDYYYECGQEA